MISNIPQKTTFSMNKKVVFFILYSHIINCELSPFCIFIPGFTAVMIEVKSGKEL